MRSSSPASHTSRREFLRRAAALSGTVGSGALPFAMNLAAMNAAAAAASDYKAIVCLFLLGGNDSANMVLPTDTASWEAYTTVRSTGTSPIALKAAGTPADGAAAPGSPESLGGVLPLVPDFTAYAQNANRSFAVHPLMPEVQSLFGQGRLAVVANAGPLVMPVTRAELKAKTKAAPAKLGSHNDQQSTWQALGPEGARKGWGGRLGDMLASANTQTAFTSISVSGNAVFLAGQQVAQYQVSNTGAVPIDGVSGGLFGSSIASTAYRQLLTQGSVPGDQPNLIAREHAAIAKRSLDAQVAFNAAYSASTAPGTPKYLHPLTRTLVGNPVAEQLRTVARVIGARDSLGVRRQVFFVSVGGFDTHDWQNTTHANLMAMLSHAIGYFDNALGALGMRDQVTLFTASDFGRTFASNGDGTDHGWGAHHLVTGGAVRGREIYGRFPQVGLNHPDEIGSGTFLPGVSVDQLGGTLGRWFGASDSQLDLVFPNLRNFDRDLGFMHAA
ncbi:DUF1501 domain-containing protein [Rhizobacter sp. Root1221]|uniref:DUF1501 domain-containing protein n=1 Tax=Rhizobacter sp. Root1221 TaxID=1736433 RepID=UPI0006F278B0|nr:DUF1501 domain-containing protein [Rhizobacter sp. Root1221]KQV86751.1 hypothetical protein ASC87_29395 [Rhizobacter sp. Root1221]